MKVKIELEQNETLEESELKLEKALKGKRKAHEHSKEEYSDPALNEFHDRVSRDHLKVIEDIKNRLNLEITRLVLNKN